MGRSLRQVCGSDDKPSASVERKLHNVVTVYMGSGGLPPDPVHGEVRYTGQRSKCDCDKGEDHGVKWLNTKAEGVRRDTKPTCEPLTKRELAHYLAIKKV